MEEERVAAERVEAEMAAAERVEEEMAAAENEEEEVTAEGAVALKVCSQKKSNRREDETRMIGIVAPFSASAVRGDNSADHRRTSTRSTEETPR